MRQSRPDRSNFAATRAGLSDLRTSEEPDARHGNSRPPFRGQRRHDQNMDPRREAARPTLQPAVAVRIAGSLGHRERPIAPRYPSGPVQVAPRHETPDRDGARSKHPVRRASRTPRAADPQGVRGLPLQSSRCGGLAEAGTWHPPSPALGGGLAAQVPPRLPPARSFAHAARPFRDRITQTATRPTLAPIHKSELCWGVIVQICGWMRQERGNRITCRRALEFSRFRSEPPAAWRRNGRKAVCSPCSMATSAS